ncbi:MAG TPA: extracellular solute-binding protein [Chloroflexia bacterium]|nr:extracellular solute-binding protein [Chloroflexia bacterium]
MASLTAKGAPASPLVRTTLMRQGLILSTGSLFIGTALPLLWMGERQALAVALLILGALLAYTSGRRIWQIWSAFDTVISRLEDATLVPIDTHGSTAEQLSSLATTLSGVGQNVRHLVMQLQAQADQVRDIALHIGREAEGHNGNAVSQAGAISEVAAAMGELERIIGHVTATAHEVALAATRVLAASQSSRQVVDTAVDSLMATQARVSETLGAIEALRARAEQIGAISDLISQIADHTHILALNAAIEAAGAGQAGQRFGVVAGEVRTLALNTREQGRQVGVLVHELEQAMMATLVAAQSSLDQTARTTELTQTLTSTTGDLAATAQQTQELAGTIDGAMAQQRASAAEVTRALTHIADSAHGMRTQTGVMATQATELIGLARQLRGSALRFGVTEAHGGLLRMVIVGRETVSSRGRAWQALVDGWNREHPEASVAIEFLPPTGDFVAELAQQFATGHAPDILQVINGTEFARQGYLLPLDGLLTPSVKADFYAPGLECSRYGNHLYSLPTEAQPMVILYNRRLFAELGVEAPRTWDELISIGKRCQTAKRAALIMETAPSEYRAKQWLPFTWQGGGDVTDAAGQVRLDTPAFQAALRFWHDLVVTHRLVPMKRPHPFYDIANLAEGHCAMQLIGSWGLTQLHEQHPGFDFGIMDLPIPAGGRPANIVLRYGLAVSAQSTHKEEASAFVRWVLADESPAGVARARSLMVEGVPIRRSIVPLVEQEGPVDASWRFMLDTIYPHAKNGPEWSEPAARLIDDAMSQAIADYQP